jgi:transcriptional regulator with XRE-family HTH domain
LNETLRRALLRARLTEEDVAARLEVDPKTVRRWLEGRVPYLRHRWAIASMLDLDEADLWPQVSATRSRPEEVRAIYPHRDDVPLDFWRILFGSAAREISILAESALFLAEDPGILAVLGERARAAVKMRICLCDPNTPYSALGSAEQRSHATSNVRTSKALTRFEPLREVGEVEIHLHRAALNNAIYRADNECLIGQYVYGVAAGQSPVLHLRGYDDSHDLINTYLESFERIWADTLPST